MLFYLPEAKDREADKGSILGLCKTVFDLDIPISSVIQLGKRLIIDIDLYWLALNMKMTRLLLFCMHTYYIVMINLKELLLLQIELSLNVKSIRS